MSALCTRRKELTPIEAGELIDKNDAKELFNLTNQQKNHLTHAGIEKTRIPRPDARDAIFYHRLDVAALYSKDDREFWRMRRLEKALWGTEISHPDPDMPVLIKTGTEGRPWRSSDTPNHLMTTAYAHQLGYDLKENL